MSVEKSEADLGVGKGLKTAIIVFAVVEAVVIAFVILFKLSRG
jgi:hypothetical protein